MKTNSWIAEVYPWMKDLLLQGFKIMHFKVAQKCTNIYINIMFHRLLDTLIDCSKVVNKEQDKNYIIIKTFY